MLICRRVSLHPEFGPAREKPDKNGVLMYQYFPNSKPSRNIRFNSLPPISRPANPQPVLKPRVQSDRYSPALTPRRAGMLAKSLGLPSWATEHFHGVGYRVKDAPHPQLDPPDESWTFAEKDGAGNIIGFAVRHFGGGKSHVYGTSRGLFAPPCWDASSNPLLLVEGASDTLAALAAGLSAIGRPSNTGGVDYLAEMLANVPAERPIVVVGENDLKPGDHPTAPGRWPGRTGAYETATKLAAAMGRPIRWGMIPGGVKDTRDWLTANASSQKRAAWEQAGQDLQTMLLAGSIETSPGIPSDADVQAAPECRLRAKLRLKGREGRKRESMRAHYDANCKRWQCEGCRIRKANEKLSWFYRCIVQWADPLRFHEAIPKIDATEVAEGIPPANYPADFPSGPWALHWGLADARSAASTTELIRRWNKDLHQKTEFVSVQFDPKSLCGYRNYCLIDTTTSQLDRLFIAAI